MAGWFTVPADDWYRQRMDITQKWPDVLAIADLRFWADPKACSQRARPRNADLAATWGWSKSRVQRLVADQKRWRDSMGHKRVDDGSPMGRRDHGETDESPDDGSKVGRKRVDDGSGLKETHAQPPALSPTHSSSDEEEDSHSDSTTTATAWDRCNDIIRTEVCPAVSRPYRKLSPSKGMGLSLKARITDHGVDDIIRLLRWYATSDHERARFLRSGGHWLKTLLRSSNCEEYLGMLDDAEPGQNGEWSEDDEPMTPEMEAASVAEYEKKTGRKWGERQDNTVIPFPGGQK